MRDAAREVIRLLAHWRLFGRIGPELRREWRLVTIATTCLLAGTAVTLVRPWPAQVLIDDVIGDRHAPPWFALLLLRDAPALLLDEPTARRWSSYSRKAA